MTRAKRIGLDFDNTLICYDEVFLSLAREQRLVAADFLGGKQAVRDEIRLLPDGEVRWQTLQGHVYGRAIANASLAPGVDGFLRRCRREECTVLIVSHKTEFGHYDPEQVNLREAAMGWMTDHGFFDDGGFGIPRANVFMEGDRASKLARIRELGCTHFVDDLVEVLTDPGYPDGVERILYGCSAAGDVSSSLVCCPTWRDVEQHVFGRDC